ncbi:MAG: ATP-binding cassette domain-containing protein [Bacteroidales bacterium]|nr:ATP-binding cassette domain-containing protein [Bacteroidales bacterium]
MISLNNVTVRFGGIALFNQVSFMIRDREKIALAGRNGAGKSTILKLIKGIISCDEGEVVVPQDQVIGYLPQTMILNNQHTVLEESLVAFQEIRTLENKIHQLGRQLEERDDYESVSYLNLIHELTEANERFDILGGSNIMEDVEKTLLGLGFRKDDLNKPSATFSGGWRMRIELAKVLLVKPDVLLLDEPTNHLDIESIMWLENFLVSYPKSVLLISHDRTFLDRVTNRTIEINLGKIHDYNVPYSKYLVLRVERKDQVLATYKNQQKLIKKTEEFIEKFRYKATKANQVQSRVKQLEKLERIEIEENESSIHFKFPPAPRSGDIVVKVSNLSKNYGTKNILKDVNLTIERGEKIAFVGKNGEGKTTLAKIIAENLEHSGECKPGHNVSIGYYAQNQDELLNENKTVFQTIDDEATGNIRLLIRNILGAFLFGGEDVDKKVKVLSGGERSRLSMIKLLLKPVSLLILDEPTNHLDIQSKDILKKALLDYTGTLMIVSHDRYFMDGLVQKVFEFRDKQVKEHIGGIFEFLKKHKLDSLGELDKAVIKKQKNQREIKNKSSKEQFQARKKHEQAIRKLKNRINLLESQIEELENLLEKMDKALQDPTNAKTDVIEPEFYKEYNKLKINHDHRLYEWEILTTELEEKEAASPRL